MHAQNVVVSNNPDKKGLTVIVSIVVSTGECSATVNLYVFCGNMGLLSLLSLMVIVTVAVDSKPGFSSSVAITCYKTQIQETLQTCAMIQNSQPSQTTD